MEQMERGMRQMERMMEEMRIENRRAMNIREEMNQNMKEDYSEFQLKLSQWSPTRGR